jgi:hypothetical protein
VSGGGAAVVVQKSKSCLKEIGSPSKHGQVKWSLSNAECKRELYQYRYSSYQRYYWDKWSRRVRQPKARFDSEVISKSEIAARISALELAEQGKDSQGVVAVASTEERCYILDSGASFNLIGRKFMTRKEVSRIKRAALTIALTTATCDVEINETVDIYVADLKMTFTFWVLPEVPPILSIGYLVKHYGFSFSWELDDGQEAMRIKLPQGEIMDSLLVNDVPRIFVANQSDEEQVLDSQAVDRGDQPLRALPPLIKK